ncbi:MAG: hypothetical protein RL518_832 [Pseudomonadota bacterium]|jgi:hypothetical protein
MNIQTLIAAQQSTYGASSQSMTRHDKASHLLGSALPTGILTGLQALNSTTSLGVRTAASAAAPALPAAAATLGSAANITGGILGALDLAMNWGRSNPTAAATSGMALGASIGTIICPGPGTAIGVGLGALFGGLLGCITTGKHKDQQVRDSVRDLLVQGGILNEQYQLQLPDGSLYDMGKDGGPREEFGGRRPYEIDLSNPLAQYAIGWMDPIIALLAPGNSKIRTDFVGYFTNAILTNAKDLNDVRRNVDFFLGKFGLSNETLANAVVQMAQAGAIDQQTAQGWIGGIRQRMDETFRGDFEPTSTRRSEATQAGD